MTSAVYYKMYKAMITMDIAEQVTKSICEIDWAEMAKRYAI